MVGHVIREMDLDFSSNSSGKRRIAGETVICYQSDGCTGNS